MDSSVFNGVVVPKPWGFERLLFSNSSVELWRLDIAAGGVTSMHCHPSKKTGLVVLDGVVVVDYMTSTNILLTLGKTMIRPGLFHQTKSMQGATVLEIETPPDKSDLVRLDDRYGRAGLPYEPQSTYVVDTDGIRFDQFDVPYRMGVCSLVVTRDDGVFVDDDYGVVVVVLSGCILAGDKPVLSAGDIIAVSTYRRLVSCFVKSNLEFLVIRKVG